MLFTACVGAGVMTTRDRQPVQRTGWMRREPAPELNRTEQLRLAPGIWIVRRVSTWPATALAIAAFLPCTDPESLPVRRGHLIPGWQGLAACIGVPHADDLFFGIDDEGHPPLPPRFFRAARAICAECPVKRECLTQALAEPEQFGVWAGTTGRQRVPLRARVKAGESVEAVVSGWLTV